MAAFSVQYSIMLAAGRARRLRRSGRGVYPAKPTQALVGIGGTSEALIREENYIKK